MKEPTVTNYLQEWCGLYSTYRCWFLHHCVWNSREIASIMFELPVLHSFKENWLTPVSPLFCSLFLQPAEPPPCLYFSLVFTFPLPTPEKIPGSRIPASDEPSHQRNLWCLCHSCQAQLLLSDRAVSYLQVFSAHHLHSVQIPRHQCPSVSIIAPTTDMAWVES